MSRLVRDQANKTFDVYVQRIRKHATTLPDTALPPPTGTAANSMVPRIGTPQHDTGWAGWAISSFTHKLATARGDMQVHSSKPQAGPEPVRSSSMPPTTDAHPPAFAAASASRLHRQAVGGSPAPVLTRTSTDQFFGDAQEEDDEVDEAWGDMADESFFDAPLQQKSAVEPKPSEPFSLVDDGGEPDFVGWLNAQNQTKTKKPLPKGLSKPASLPNNRQAAIRSTTTGQVGSRSGAEKVASVISTASKIPSATAINTKPKEPAADDDWGDAWD